MTNKKRTRKYMEEILDSIAGVIEFDLYIC